MSDLASLSVARGLELLERLQSTVAAFTREEADLARRLRMERYRVETTQTETRERHARDLAARRAAVEETFATTHAYIQARHDQRRARIQSAVTSGLREAPRRGRDERERWLGELQLRHFVLQRRLQSERDAAEETLARQTAALAQRRTTLRRLDRHARDALLGYPGFLHRPPTPAESTEPPSDADAALRALDDQIALVERRLAGLRALALPRIFSLAPLWATLPLVAVGLLIAARQTGDWVLPGSLAAGVTMVLAGLYILGKRHARPLAPGLLEPLAAAHDHTARCAAAIDAAHARAISRIDAETAAADAEVNAKWETAEAIRTDFEARQRRRFESRGPRALAQNERQRAAALRRLDETRAAQLAAVDALPGLVVEESPLDAAEAAAWQDLAARWQSALAPLLNAVAERNAVADAAFPPWTEALVEEWTPPRVFSGATKFARLDVTAPAENPRLPWPGPASLAIPLALTYPEAGSLLFETDEPVADAAISSLNQIVLRLLATTPPGKLRFTIFDPVALGQNFAGLMHLGDYEETLITRRIWTQSDQIEARLADLSQHIEKVIQMYLRDEYPTIVEYNAQAGSTAEKFHFLVIADFPANFSETAVRRLQSIVTSGPRCGVYTLIHWDRRHPLPGGVVAEELRASSVCIQGGRNGLALETAHAPVDAHLTLDPAPPAALALDFVNRVGAASVDSNQVQVPFRSIAPAPAEFWTGDTTAELRVAIGRAGATKPQMFALGRGTRQHALIAGKTGSGKSTLFHVLITNLALSCSPEQVEFYLIDFKKGVEFKGYAERRLPHARVVAIESDREFGLSVLQRVDEELRRRGDLFRRLGVQDLAGYRRSAREDDPPLPRTLLLIDEFQEFFVEEDALSQGASALLDRIVRQGRAFGIHVVLGSQTLGGAYSLARATLGQMVVRVALQCNEADAYLIMDDGNPAPRLLSRPGEGIYNDAAGAVEGNSPFQVCWLPDEERDAWLREVRALADQRPEPAAGPVVFEGNAPADLAENSLLAAALREEPSVAPAAPRIWLGAPNAIKGPTELAFPRQSGSHLLVVGQREETALALLAHGLLALGAQYPTDAARFVFLHAAPPASADEAFLQRILAATPHAVILANPAQAPAIIADLADDLARRLEGEPGVETFVFIHGLHRFRKLRPEDEFAFSAEETATPGAQFAQLVTEGGGHGMHVLAWLDSLGNVNRFLARKTLAEFERRVAFQISANDSAALLDTPKAATLGLHRALLFNEPEGTLETFRPYAPADADWLASAAHFRFANPLASR